MFKSEKNRPSKPAGAPGFTHAGSTPKSPKSSKPATGPGFTDSTRNTQSARKATSPVPKAKFSK